MKLATKLRQALERVRRKLCSLAREKSRSSVFEDDDEQALLELAQLKQELEQVPAQVDRLVARAAQARVHIEVTRSLKAILAQELQAAELDHKLLHARRCHLVRTREEKKTKIDHGFGDKGTRRSAVQSAV